MIKKNAVNINQKTGYSMLKSSEKSNSKSSLAKNKYISSQNKSTKEDSKILDETQRKDKSFKNSSNQKINQKNFNLTNKSNKNASSKSQKDLSNKNKSNVLNKSKLNDTSSKDYNLNKNPEMAHLLNSPSKEDRLTLKDISKRDDKDVSSPKNKEAILESLESSLEKDLEKEKMLILRKYYLCREFKIKRRNENKPKQTESDIFFNKQKTEIKINNKINFTSSPHLSFKQQYMFSPTSEKIPQINGCSPIKGKSNHILLKDEIDLFPNPELNPKFTILKKDLINELEKNEFISKAKQTRNPNKLFSSQKSFQTTLKNFSESKKTVNNPNNFDTKLIIPKQITVFNEFFSPKNSSNNFELDMKKTLEKFYEKNQNVIPEPNIPIKASTKFELYNLKKTSENLKKSMLIGIKNNITSMKNSYISTGYKLRNKSMI